MVLQVCLVAAYCIALTVGSSSWSYSGTNGQSHWAKKYPNCAKSRQSPINIESERTCYQWRRLRLHYEDPSSKLGFSLGNNGHSAQVTLSNIGNRYVHVFGRKFKPLQVHFHWGSNNGHGSEHTRDFRRYAGEMHFVHMNTAYKTAAEAKKHSDGLLVLGTFLTVDNFENLELAPIFNSLHKIRKQGRKTKITGLNLIDLMPYEKTEFFFYSGSLTTPGCDQAVLWIVFKDTVEVSPRQIKQLRMLTYGGAHGAVRRLVNNYRSTQATNGRKVYRSFHLPGWSRRLLKWEFQKFFFNK